MAFFDTVTVANGIAPATSKATGSITNTVTSIRNAAATLAMLTLDNPGGSNTYCQIFDAATPGAVTLGTTAPTWSFLVPAGGGSNPPMGAAGISFTNGIQIAFTTTRAGSTAPGTACDYNVAYT